MNPKSVGVRLDPETGELWLTEEKYRKPPRKVANINSHVLLALAAEAERHGGDGGMEKDICFSDGQAIRITITNIPSP